MNNNKLEMIAKTTAKVMALVLSFGAIGTYTLTAGEVPANTDMVVTDEETVLNELLTTESAPVRDGEDMKDETVYILAGADGSVEKIIVSDWIKNGSGSDSLADVTTLSDVENVNGDETYTISGSGSTVWDAKGNDIYYQGTSNKELPVSIAVSYKLDGKAISAEDLAGKSGHVTIRFDYTNHQYEMVEINGEKEKIYVPFAMLTGMMLDGDNFTNIEVSNGKMINDGSRTAVIGFAFPGLEESLKLNSDKVEIPSYVEITADVTDFELATTVTVATNQMFSSMESNKVENLDDLGDSMSQLTDAMSQLMDGSSQLYEGLNTLLSKSGDLVSGINALANGAASLKDGTKSLSDGSAQLQTGMTKLYDGLATLHNNSSALNGGATQVFNSLLNTANTQIASAGLTLPTLTIDNYAAVLNGAIAQMDGAYGQAYETVKANYVANRATIRAGVSATYETNIRAAVTAGYRAQVKEAVGPTAKANYISTTYGKTVDEFNAGVEDGTYDQSDVDAVNAAVESAVDAQMPSYASAIDAEVASRMASDETEAAIDASTDAQIETLTNDYIANDPTIQAQLAAANAGAQSLISLKTSLDSYNQFYRGLQVYTAGVDTATAGAYELKVGTDQLKSGADALNDGASQLYEGLQQLQSKTPALVDGIKQLRDGSMQLSDGLQQFNDEGVQKLVDAVDGDLAQLAGRLEAISDVSKNYNNYSGIAGGMDGDVKFIYKTAAIEAE